MFLKGGKTGILLLKDKGKIIFFKIQGIGNTWFHKTPLIDTLYLIVGNYSFPQRETINWLGI